VGVTLVTGVTVNSGAVAGGSGSIAVLVFTSVAD
jgi:hypothetical protein